MIINTDTLLETWHSNQKSARKVYNRNPTKDNHRALIQASEKVISLERLCCHLPKTD